VGVFKLAVEQGIKCVFVSNGNATPQVLDYLRPYLSAYKIDLKTMNDQRSGNWAGTDQRLDDRSTRAGVVGGVVTLVIRDSATAPRAAGLAVHHPSHLTSPGVTFPPRLQDDRTTPNPGEDPSAGSGDRAGGRIEIRVCRQPARQPARI
jgi:hypothetical protein